jgi:hypothetical protein
MGPPPDFQNNKRLNFCHNFGVNRVVETICRD